MIVAMQENATEDQIQVVTEHLIEMGFSVHRTTGERQTILAAVGARSDFDTRNLEVLSGVMEVHRISAPYKLAGRSFRPQGTVITFKNGVRVGGKEVLVMAGPCSVESREQLFTVAEQVSKAGARALRGGAFKPRTSPYSFQGLGLEALKLLREAGDQHNMLVVSEVMEISQIELMIPYVDILQVGARNMQNFNLLRELGKLRTPVLLKRGIAATIEELLLSAEYIMAGGNYNVITCERGIRTFETYTRNTLDISAIPIVHLRSLARDWPPRQSGAYGTRLGCCRGRLAADRSPSQSRQGAVRRCAVALSGAVHGIDGLVAYDCAGRGQIHRLMEGWNHGTFASRNILLSQLGRSDSIAALDAILQ